ncbi:hypothetical protein [Mangrovibacillus cuniculi]|uniref:Uncharacterized protein n=1 Tax=Mangrovibacillus cuniculi TaxID=2593652 RepID=A0A7S8HEM4_9BACI|nr:hypothetical protein [Mangrovibacillus cuniculi]QPC45862.1 hypothetical protein G8O30_02260 [Mangrovibacillus cuniculi]
MLIYRQIFGWISGIVVMGLNLYTNVPIQKYLDNQNGIKIKEPITPMA